MDPNTARVFTIVDSSWRTVDEITKMNAGGEDRTFESIMVAVMPTLTALWKLEREGLIEVQKPYPHEPQRFECRLTAQGYNVKVKRAVEAA